MAVYFPVFGIGIAYMLRLIKKGPQAYEDEAHPAGGAGKSHTASRPLSATNEDMAFVHNPDQWS